MDQTASQEVHLLSVDEDNFLVPQNGTRSFIVVFLKDGYWSLSWARLILYTPYYHSLNVHFSIIISSCLGKSKSPERFLPIRLSS